MLPPTILGQIAVLMVYKHWTTKYNGYKTALDALDGSRISMIIKQLMLWGIVA